MTPFTYARAAAAADATRMAGPDGARYLGGGTNLVDLLREGVISAEALVDVSGLDDGITATEDGGIRIGGAARNSAVAGDLMVRTRYPVLARAILAGASGQIRNMATTAGNMLQRTRCMYFYDSASRCNKRAPGTGCDAIEGFNRMHAVLGASPACVAVHPSDMCVALTMLDATVELQGAGGARTLPFGDLHRLPEGLPELDTMLEPGELITTLTLPAMPLARRSTYRKIRDRASYAFALVSVAAALEIGDDGRIADVRIALGGVAHKPWRAHRAEEVLRGASADARTFRVAAEAEMADAAPLRDNGFKIELARRAMVSVLEELA